MNNMFFFKDLIEKQRPHTQLYHKGAAAHTHVHRHTHTHMYTYTHTAIAQGCLLVDERGI